MKATKGRGLGFLVAMILVQVGQYFGLPLDEAMADALASLFGTIGGLVLLKTPSK